MATDVAAAYGAAKTSVWWDLHNCRVPYGCDANSIALNISSALVNLKYHGPVSISAYGDTNRIPFQLQRALSSTGIALNHIPSGVKETSDKKIMVDMLFWAVDNPAPANYLLISGDSEFSNALHQLSMRRYNILLAQPQPSSPPLTSAAKVIWQWTTLSAGGPPFFNTDSDTPTVNLIPPSPPKFRTKPQYIKKTTKSLNFSTLPTSPLPLPEIKNKTNDDAPNAEQVQPNTKLFPSTYKGVGEVDEAHNNFSEKNMVPSKNKNNNDASNPEQVQPSTKLFRSAPHEFFGNYNDSNGLASSEYEQGLIGVILLALDTLKVEKVLPTERNITDCIRFGDPRFQNTDVKKALGCAVEQNCVVKQTLGAMHLYVGKIEKLWECVNHIGGHPRDFPNKTWTKIKQFLTSSSGRSSILASRCRYEAGLILKRSCLGDLVLGDILKILEIMITDLKWIVLRHSGPWQPITITLAETGHE